MIGIQFVRRAGALLTTGALLFGSPLAAQGAPLGISATRAGSGTTWMPDASPMHAVHAAAGQWTLNAHGTVFLQYDRQNGPRGSTQFGSINWGMLMAARPMGGGTLQLRGMISLEPFTVGNSGYPLLLQSGETYRGTPLVDRQHPHDLFMELAVQYERAITKDLGISLYAAPVGEPAVGPVAFMHRPSAANDPFAPLSHHWQDATHVVFGTVTAGLFTKTFKLEASLFNGREPDEIRTNFDYAGRSLDSYAGRLTWNPTAQWSVSGSFAYLHSPEGLTPDESLLRIGGSAMYARALADGGSLALTAVYGANRHDGASHLEPSYLAEGNVDFRARHSLFGRVESLKKDAADLALASSTSIASAQITEFVLGYAYDLNTTGPARIGVGVRGSVHLIPNSLASLYGSNMPSGVALFLRIRPAAMATMGAGHHHTMKP